MFRSVCLAVLLALVLFSCNGRKARLMAEGDALVAEIEAYRDAHGALPASLSDLGREEKMEGPLYYQLEGDSAYMVSFGMEVGESMIYRSATGAWRDH